MLILKKMHLCSCVWGSRVGALDCPVEREREGERGREGIRVEAVVPVLDENREGDGKEKQM